MKVSPAFFRTEPVLRIMNRSAAAVAVPVSLHYHADDDSEIKLNAWGGCAGCAWVCEQETGVRACARSRSEAAAIALSQNVTTTFVCHLGFTCVSIVALPETNYLLTFGPYLPTGSEQGIGYDVVRALWTLEALPKSEREIPFPLEDVRAVPAGSISAAAEWLVEALCDAHSRHVADEADAEAARELEEALSAVRGVSARPEPAETPADPDAWASLAALALICGHSAITREMLKSRLEEAAMCRRMRPDAAQAFLMRAIAQVLEAARDMGGNAERAFEAYPSFLEEMGALYETEDMLDAAVRLLRRVRGQAKRKPPPGLVKLVGDVQKRYMEKLELREIAEDCNVAASSLTRALECRINATFSEYLGRVRVEHACRLLRDTTLSASSVGRKVGIHDQSNFRKAFFRYVGMTPKAYRGQFKG